jgi:predicted Ser/Thr protein kinase
VTRAAGSDARPRKRIGKYVLTGRIGKGGMGRVYCGYDEALEREVAVKTLSYEGSQDDDHRRRFSIEAKAAARLQHPNIVTVYELGEDRGVPFIAMELLPGVDLEALLRSGDPLVLHEALDVMVQVCRGLHFAHERGIVHRDMKPSNIRVLDDGTAKIMDFGIAKLGASGITKSGMMVGTIHYMSPEQIRGHALDGRSDVFSLGVILYELIAGGRPFQGQAATEILYKIVHEEPPPLPADALGEAGPLLQDIVRRALAKDPGARCPSAAALGEDLARVLGLRAREAAAEEPELLEAVKQARALVVQDRVEEGLARLRELAARHPQALEARRALRWAVQEAKRRHGTRGADHDDYPELEATFQSAPTASGRGSESAPAAAPAAAAEPAPPVGEAQTRLAAHMPPTVLATRTGLTRLLPQPVQEMVAGRPLLAVGGAALVLALSLGVYFASGTGAVRPLPSPSAQPTAVAVPVTAPATVSLMEVTVHSDPPGARLTLDGEPVPGTTPLTVALDPQREHRLRVALAGHATREVQVAAGQGAPELRIPLEPSGPLGRVALTSTYPVDVLWKGRSLAREQTAAVLSLPAGRQTVTLVAAPYLLRATVTVDVPPGGEAVLTTPTLGRINVRANPDNCKVFVDGSFIDYPPILDRRLAAGVHTVAFVWPDGTRREETVDVGTSGPAYVMGRRE